MIRAYGNHPSFMILSASNEPKGTLARSRCRNGLSIIASRDPRRLYASGTGHTERAVRRHAEGTDYLAMQRINPEDACGVNPAGLAPTIADSLDDINIPVISHELGQWVAYPDYDIIKEFTGYMRPGNYEIFRDSLEEQGLLRENKDFATPRDVSTRNATRKRSKQTYARPDWTDFNFSIFTIISDKEQRSSVCLILFGVRRVT